MARVYREVHQTHVRDNPDYVDDSVVATNGSNMAERIVYLIGGLIIALLGLRFLLALLGANPANSFANFIYTTSRFFAQPFFGLFNYHSQFGITRFEYETLIAIVVYALLTWFIGRLVGLGRDRDN